MPFSMTTAARISRKIRRDPRNSFNIPSGWPGLDRRDAPVRGFRGFAKPPALTPRCRNSGETTDRLGSITKQGSRLARFILGQLVLHLLKQDAWMRQWYQGIKRRRGAKIARVAVMRRLTTIIWHVLTHERPYEKGGPHGARHQRTAVKT